MIGRYLRHKVCKFRSNARVDSKPELAEVADHGPHAYVVLSCCHADPVERGLSYSSGGIIDHATQTLIVIGIYGQSEIGEQIFNFFPLIKTNSSVNLIRNIQLSERFLEAAGLGVGAVKNCEIPMPGLIAVKRFKNIIR